MTNARYKFIKLRLEHKNLIENFIKQFPPYSDYNFTSLWTYNTEDAIEFSFLNENLVVKFTDYLDNSQFFSFLGKNQVDKTVDQLINYSIQKRLTGQLKLIPEVVVNRLKSKKHCYKLIEDIDNHDYIVSTKEICDLHPIKFKRKRYLVERFKRKYPDHKVVRLNLKDLKIQNQIFKLFKLWEEQSGRTKTETINELRAIKRLFSALEHLQIYGVGIYLKRELVAFNTYETTHTDYGISSFQKANKNLTGIYAFLTHEATKHLFELGCAYVNHEQDLGIEGLRLSKSLWKPNHFLKKYIIRPK